MWHWDQGRLQYFQFDAIRAMARFAVQFDFMAAERPQLFALTGLKFAAPVAYSAWRNYSRILKLCLLVSERNGVGEPTPVATILARDGAVTCDEYLHFLARAFTEPAPALQDWTPKAKYRFPLLFVLKYLLAKTAIKAVPAATLDEILGGYRDTGYIGDEDDSAYITAVSKASLFEKSAKSIAPEQKRQARESLRFISQISYLNLVKGTITVSLDPVDARDVFADLEPIRGTRAANREAEIRRLSTFFQDGTTSDIFDYPHTIIGDVVESGFQEGSKVKRTHVVIERNSNLRKEFFNSRPTPICDVCCLNTSKTYPWASRIMDLHHLLPLSSGTRVEATGTTFDDLVPVCPSCHRAVHRYYEKWLIQNQRQDFESRSEAVRVYGTLKAEFLGLIYAR